MDLLCKKISYFGVNYDINDGNNNSQDENTNFVGGLFDNKINIDGEIEIGKKIINSLSLRENTSNKQLSDLTLFSSFKIDEIAKNSKGQTETYRSSIVVNVKIIDDQKIIKNKIFSDDFTYNKKNNKFELTEYQEDVKNQLVNRIIEDLILFLNM